MHYYLTYLLKCVGALFAVFLMAGSLGSLVLGDSHVDKENVRLVTAAMLGGAVAAWYWFWPKWPKNDEMLKVTLHVYTEPYEEEGDEILPDGTKVIGEVRRADEVLYSKQIITDGSIESVCGVKESIALEIETWAVQHTDFIPTEDALPS